MKQMPEKRVGNSFTSPEVEAMQASGELPNRVSKLGSDIKCGRCHRFVHGSFATVKFVSESSLRISPRVVRKLSDEFALCERCIRKEFNKYKNDYKLKKQEK